jgi:hypothetical protein
MNAQTNITADPSMPCPHCEGVGYVPMLYAGDSYYSDDNCFLCDCTGIALIADFKAFAARNSHHYSKADVDSYILEAGYCPDHLEPLDDDFDCMTCAAERLAA